MNTHYQDPHTTILKSEHNNNRLIHYVWDFQLGIFLFLEIFTHLFGHITIGLEKNEFVIIVKNGKQVIRFFNH